MDIRRSSTLSTALLLASLSLTLGSCASPHAARDLSSASTPSSGEAEELEMTDASPAPHAKALESKLRRLIHGFGMGLHRLEKFDQSISKFPNSARLFATRTYRELLALRLVTHRERHHIKNAYLKLVRESLEGNPEAKKAMSAFVSTYQNVLNANGNRDFNEVALSDLVNDIDEGLKQPGVGDTASLDRLIQAKPEFAKFYSANSLLPSSLDIAQQTARFVAIQGSWLKAPHRSIASETEFEEEISEIADELVAEDAGPTTPAADDSKTASFSSNPDFSAKDRIHPDEGPAGNVWGNEFPAKTWALTFDDGPHDVHTAKVLANLKKHHMKATFFALAQNLTVMKTLALQEKSAGHALADHSYSHPVLSSDSMTHEKMDHEIRQSKIDEEKVWGTKISYFRCPYGDCIFSKKAKKHVVRRMIADLGMVHINWNVDTLDWQDKNPVSVKNRAIAEMKINKKGVILFHDVHPQSVIASEMIMTYLENNGMREVTIPEIVDEINGKKRKGEVASEESTEAVAEPAGTQRVGANPVPVAVKPVPFQIPEKQMDLSDPLTPEYMHPPGGEITDR
ncbi:MAG: polysaccharide deacetylase family protein [Methylotenera sp.]|nr:polysaccharide deacetylase family protein [Oligoflexia bacterium]